MPSSAGSSSSRTKISTCSPPARRGAAGWRARRLLGRQPERGVRRDPRKQVRRLAVAGALFGGGSSVHAQALVQLLAIAAPPDGFHQDVLGCEKRQLGLETPPADVRMHDEARGHVLEEQEDGVGREKGLGHGDPLVGGSSRLRSSHCVRRSSRCRTRAR
jgi:hypothetical protein